MATRLKRALPPIVRPEISAVTPMEIRIVVVAMGMLSDEALAEFLRNRPEDLEVVMTGRAPTPCTDPLADYITRMQKVRHPFDKGLNARLGVEF